MSRLVNIRKGMAPALGLMALAAAAAGCSTAGHSAPPTTKVHVTTTTAPATTVTTATTLPTTTSTSTTSPPATAVEYVAPVDSSGIPTSGYKVTETASGNCETGSDSVSAAVYRCFYGNYVTDPCWATKAGGVPTGSVLCLGEPWSTSVVKLETKGLEPASAQAADPSYPWGVKLTSGLECVAVQGAHGSYDGQDINYYCGTNGLQLLGKADRASALWTFQSVNFNGTTFVSGPTVQVQTAWFAA